MHFINRSEVKISKLFQSQYKQKLDLEHMLNDITSLVNKKYANFCRLNVHD
jgi:hypothetical protein